MYDPRKRQIYIDGFLLCFSQTPFNFGPHPLGMEQQSPGKELPKTNAALLDFHASENPVKHNKTYGTAASFLYSHLNTFDRFGKAKVQKATTEVGRKEIGKNFAVMPDWEDPGNHPTDAGAESFRITDHEWDSITPHHQHRCVLYAEFSLQHNVSTSPL